MQIILQSRPAQWCGLLLAGLTLTACVQGRDETQLQPQTRTAGGSGGSSGASAGGSGGAAGADAGLESRDAGADADVMPRACGTLESYCNATGFSWFTPRCPDLASALPALRGAGSRFIVKRSCSASDGSARVSVAATLSSGNSSGNLIYDPATGALVGVEFMDDLNRPCYGDLSSVSGDCSSTWPDDSFFAGCDRLDAGAPATLSDAGSFGCEVADAGR